MRFGSLFAGIGGLDLGLERAGMECAWQVEIGEFQRRVLTKHWPDVPKYKDIRDVGRENLEEVDLIAGGFPCQPFSVAGKRRGTKDDRHLWPEMLRVIQELRPTWVLGENVPGIIKLFLDQAITDLESEGYTCEPFVIPAVAFDTPHRRDRLFIVGYSEHNGYTPPEVSRSIAQRSNGGATRKIAASKSARPSEQHASMADTRNTVGRRGRIAGEGDGQGRQLSEAERASLQPGDRQTHSSIVESGSEVMADTQRERLEGQPIREAQGIQSAEGSVEGAIPNTESDESRRILKQRLSTHLASSSYWREKAIRWLSEPSVGRVAHGVPNRVDRLRGLGNAVVPQVAEFIGETILKASKFGEAIDSR